MLGFAWTWWLVSSRRKVFWERIVLKLVRITQPGLSKSRSRRNK